MQQQLSRMYVRTHRPLCVHGHQEVWYGLQASRNLCVIHRTSVSCSKYEVVGKELWER